MPMKKTGERMIPEQYKSIEERIIFFMHEFAYRQAYNAIDISDIILDYGCGEGYGSFELAKKAEKVIGVDVNQEAIRLANDKYRKDNLNFSVLSGNLKSKWKEHFTKITSFQVIEHIKDDHGYLAEIKFFLISGGTFFLSTPNRLNRLKSGQKPWNRFHVREYSPRELEKLLCEYFSEVRVCGVFAAPEIRKIEDARIKRIRKISALDPFNLRSLVPESLKPSLIARLNQFFKNKDLTTPKEAIEVSLADFSLAENNLDECIDIFALCQK